MSDRRRKGRHLRRALGLTALVSLFGVGCHHHEKGGSHGAPARSVRAEVIVLKSLGGDIKRPPVEFRHELHAKALAQEGCDSCHVRQEKQLLFTLKGVSPDSVGEERRDSYHKLCFQCHEGAAADREDGAPPPDGAACGSCHRVQPLPESERVPMVFDLSLHQRHMLAENERCETCHHVYNEQTKQLEHRPGTEEACSACHGPTDEGKRLSWRRAAHRSCINCHQQKGPNEQTGPDQCGRCHDQAGQDEITKMDHPPRLKRGQKDRVWIHTSGATSHVVAFNHLDHEGRVDRCSACHHNGMGKCGDCHSVTGRPEGGGVTLEQAFHRADSSRSCVGCHQQVVMADPRCAGCHHALTEAPLPQSCPRCHNGPRPADMNEDALAQVLAPPVPALLPDRGENFPAQVNIDVLRESYGPSPFPHVAIAEALNREAGQSGLALHFHAGAGAPCAGCHHRGAVGTRPPPCRSCHKITGETRRDQPGLLAAYHRQCIGCHQQMSLETGCTYCHESVGGTHSIEGGAQRRSAP